MKNLKEKSCILIRMYFFQLQCIFLTENRIFFSSYEQSFFPTWHEKIIIRILYFEIECNKNIRASKTIRTFFCTRNAFSLQLERNCRV